MISQVNEIPTDIYVDISVNLTINKIRHESISRCWHENLLSWSLFKKLSHETQKYSFDVSTNKAKHKLPLLKFPCKAMMSTESIKSAYKHEQLQQNYFFLKLIICTIVRKNYEHRLNMSKMIWFKLCRVLLLWGGKKSNQQFWLGYTSCDARNTMVL